MTGGSSPQALPARGSGGTAGTDPILRAFRGAVALSQATDEDLERISRGSIRRGLRGHHNPARALSESQQLDALCQWLHEDHHLNAIGTVTFSDHYAQRHAIYSFDRALDDTWAGLNEAHFHWKFVLAAEWHRSGREVPHVHLALEIPDHLTDRVLDQLRRYFDGTRGRSRFEVMRDTTAATLYGLKDTVKSSKIDTSGIRLRLHRPRRRKRSGPSGGVGPTRRAEHGPQPIGALPIGRERGPDEPF